MLEEITMEKKLNRSITTPKGTVETKKNQDAVAGKSFPKSSRKREKHSPKLEQCIRRPGNSTAKNKHNSRKSTSRASHHVGGGKDSELADLDDDFDLRGSKKRNLTHLLNFHCKPRESEINTSRRATVRSPFHNTIRNLMSTQIHKYNKEQFLQANCQFVVKDGGDYSVYLADPDILVDWKLIEQILVPSSEPLVCPICLDYPSAGKITRCGHVYCWSCILHYMSLSDNSWQKCPICFESIYGKDLKSVKLLKQNIYNVGDEITFQLMKREQGSTVAIPVLELSSRISNVLLPVSGNGCSIVYSKLLLGDQKNILSIIEIEENELHKELVENKECPEVCYVEQAIQLLNERKQKLLEEITKINFFNVENISSDNSQNKNNNNILISHMESVDAGTFREISDTESQIENVSDLKKCINEQCVPEHEFRQSEEICSDTTGENYEININPVVVPIKESFFYQADDGQQIFLHSLNVRMLELQCGSLECSPIFIKGRIVEIEMGSMTDDLRKRLRHLQHLPTTCQFQVVEIVFVEPIIREEFLSYFKDHIEERSRRREKRAREEKKLQKKAEQLTKQQFGSHSPPRRLRLDSLHHFPECGSDTPPNASPTNRSSVSSRASSPLSTASRRSVSPVTKSLNSLSVNNNTFAQKLKGNNKDGIWQKRVTVSEREAGTSHSGNLISDAVEAALLKARMEKENKFTDDQQTSGKNKKKKRQKPIPLCSVGMVYSHR